MPRRRNAKDSDEPTGLPLSFFACPNGDCADFNCFDAGNLSVVERMGKDKAICEVDTRSVTPCWNQP